MTTIFTTQVPAAGNDYIDPNPLEIGVRFRSDIAGQVTALRFYKVSGNTGQHIGHLWSNAGTLLSSVTFSGESATGWQTMSLPSPITIQANTTYVASYFTTTGYAVTLNYFATAGVDNPPLHAVQSSTSGLNGLYTYSSAPVFPSKSTNASNYWVDVVFSTSSAGLLGSAELLHAPEPTVQPGLASGFPNFAQTRVYPNPWRANQHAGLPITIKPLPPNSTVKIFTMSAELVRTLDASGDTVLWDLVNNVGQAVASGFYVYLATDANDQKRGLIGIIR
jgi:hypothetical protein